MAVHTDELACVVIDDEATFVDAIRPTLADVGFTRVLHVAPADAADAPRLEGALTLVAVDPSDPTSVAMADAVLGSERGSRVVAVTETSAREDVETIRGRPFSGHVTKDVSLGVFAAAMRALVDGDNVVPVIIDTPRPASVPPTLSTRERAILSSITSGASDKTIARSLGISPHTVRSHVRNTLHKLGVHTRAEAAVWAVRRGWV